MYPRRLIRETEMAIPRVEDEGKLRADGRVMAERGATRPTLREVQRNMGQWQALHSRGTGGNLRQQLKALELTEMGPYPNVKFKSLWGRGGETRNP